MACKNSKGEWVLINGNQTCLLFLYYIITNRKAKGLLKPTDFIVKTIVTTEIIKKVADKAGIEMRDCYTGFKWIAREIAISEGKQQYIGGGEESYGFLAEDFVRDKDAVTATLLACEIAAFAKAKGSSFYKELLHAYTKYGFYKEYLISLVKKGISGSEEIAQMMKNLRENPLKEIGGEKVTMIHDIQTSISHIVATGKVSTLNIPKSNVLIYYTENGTKIAARPSGTEPKIKFYFSVNTPLERIEDFEATQKILDGKIQKIVEELKLK